MEQANRLKTEGKEQRVQGAGKTRLKAEGKTSYKINGK